MPPAIYIVRVKGQLSPLWSEWFDGMQVVPEENGGTRISGPVSDQPALHALLVRIRDLGLTLLSMERQEMPECEKEEN